MDTREAFIVLCISETLADFELNPEEAKALDILEDHGFSEDEITNVSDKLEGMTTQEEGLKYGAEALSTVRLMSKSMQSDLLKALEEIAIADGRKHILEESLIQSVRLAVESS